VESFLAVLATRARHELSDVDTRAVYDGAGVATGLRAYLREHPSELVVIGSRVTTGVSHAFFRSTSADILRGSPSPVLAVPVVTRSPSRWWRRFFRRERVDDRIGDHAR
jgi:nucleotide-binding universal stress UspA family protein